ncbi:unnamed protein product [Schistosoma turkestanicum]|nr:unnamed protein product [Schistosoma turkestanicum]
MSASVVSALVKFGETLGDKSVDTNSKLRVLSTLNEVKLTLSELSESGVGRAVRKLKNEPGELGKTASTLILKWKNLLSEHIKQESINLNVPTNSENSAVNDISKSVSRTSSEGKSISVTNCTKVNSIKSPQDNFKKSVQRISPIPENEAIPNLPSNSLLHTDATSDYFSNSSTFNDSSSYPKVNHKSPNGKTKLTSNKKRKSTEIVDSIDSSSGLSFMDSLNVKASTRTPRKKKCNPTVASNDQSQQNVSKKLDVTASNIPLRPSEAFSAEIISSLSEPVNRPDVVCRSPTPQLNETEEDDFDNGDLKFKSKKVLWVPKQNRSSLPFNNNINNNNSNSSDNFPSFFDPPSLIDLCVDVLARNISRVDYVGQVPYELLAKALRGASVDDLTRIERYNPQFIGLNDDLWRKYIHRDFQHLSNIRRQSDETWCEFYNRLSKEETKRLDRIISQSARKIKEEQEIHVSGPGPPSQTSPTKLALPNTSRNQARDAESRKEKKIGHRRVTEEGTVTYKKKPTSELQGAIQLGIQHHIGSLQQKPDRDLLYGDFNIIDTVNFPREGTKTTQAHPYSDFRFRIYAPVAFRCFRKSYKLDIRDFLNSLCSQSLQELSNPGASGSIFYISQDDEFIIKTVQHKEGEFLQKLLPEYFMNLMQHPRTLLPKYYGLYCYQSGHKNIRFVVMNNLLPSSVRIHEKYDLKGSTYGRQASEAERAKSSPTLKDLDFIENHPDGIWLEAETYDALLKTIERDCLVLKSFRIMDYSLLLGIHNLDQAKRDRLAQKHASAQQTPVNQHGDEPSDLSPNSIPKMKSNGLISHIINKNNESNTNRSTSISNGIASDGFVGSINENNNKTTSSSPNGSQLPPPPTRHAHFTNEAEDDETKSPSDNNNNNNNNNNEADKSVFQRNLHKTHSQKRVVAYCTAMESIKASSEPVELESEERELIPSGGIPARDTNGDRLLLYIGVIDILQSYRILKKMEHGFKSLVTDGKTISVTHPLYYAQRFQEFLGRTVFKRIQSLDEPNVFGPHTSRFRRYAHMALKQGTSKRFHRPMAAIKTLDDTIDLADKGTTYESLKPTDSRRY